MGFKAEASDRVGMLCTIDDFFKNQRHLGDCGMNKWLSV